MKSGQSFEMADMLVDHEGIYIDCKAFHSIIVRRHTAPGEIEIDKMIVCIERISRNLPKYLIQLNKFLCGVFSRFILPTPRGKFQGANKKEI